jgi:hypothetical protein
MARKMPVFAVVICLMMMFTSNALAWDWISIVKGIAGGIIGQINTSQKNAVAVTSSEPLSPDAVLAALDQLSTQC